MAKNRRTPFFRSGSLSLGRLLLLSGFQSSIFIFYDRLFSTPTPGITWVHPTLTHLAVALAACLILFFPCSSMKLLGGKKSSAKIAALFTAGIVIGYLAVSFNDVLELPSIVLFALSYVAYTISWTKRYEFLCPTDALAVLTLSMLFTTLVRHFMYVDIYGKLICRIFCQEAITGQPSGLIASGELPLI